MPAQTVKKGHFKDMMYKMSKSYKPINKAPFPREVQLNKYKFTGNFQNSVENFERKLLHVRYQRGYGR